MRQFKDIVLYVVRRDAYGNFTNSAPCMNCFKVISELNIKKIVYSIEDNKFTMCKPCDYETKHISVGNRILLNEINNIKENRNPNKNLNKILNTKK
jgi:deoxycytidylate deaminase